MVPAAFSRVFVLVTSISCALVACAHSAAAPPLIAGERARTPKGEVTLVEFVDFECPFCRTMNDDLAPLVSEYRGRVRVVRKQVPLAPIHLHALDAARASVCAEAMGKGDEVADALFRTPPEKLTQEGCAAVGEHAGLSPSAFVDCMLNPKTLESIQADVRSFVSIGGSGVPLLWIDAQRFEGDQGPAAMRDAIETALRDDQ